MGQNGELWLGDCLELMQSIRPHSVDMVLCDLPYAITANRWDIPVPLEPLWQAYSRVCRPSAAIVLTASQPFTSKLVLSNLSAFRHEWIWIKNRGSNFAQTGIAPMKEHESVLVFSDGGWTYNKQMQERTGTGVRRAQYGAAFRSQSENYRVGFPGVEHHMLTQLRVPSSWQKFNTEIGLHPTQKPLALFEYLIRTYSNPDDLVLDNCAGSGTTAIACMNLGRSYICIERDQKYFDIAKTRIERHAA